MGPKPHPSFFKAMPRRPQQEESQNQIQTLRDLFTTADKKDMLTKKIGSRIDIPIEVDDPDRAIGSILERTRRLLEEGHELTRSTDSIDEQVGRKYPARRKLHESMMNLLSSKRFKHLANSVLMAEQILIGARLKEITEITI